VLEKPVT